ncbi:MAG: hypothetical protein KDC94_11105 [Aequorivita sp.]|nr:hypothetical protein [Aequorivita sp.]MCB0455256.1 hypothetical protein [Aequorivita sp.]MCB0467681.1 hypothetical protein [Aequorivita sp.]
MNVMEPKKDTNAPNLMGWAIKYASSAGLAGMLCCVAPAILFMFGLMGGIYAISFANFFYAEDGTAGTGAWILRGAAVLIGAYGFYKFKTKQNQCSIDPKRKRKNLILMAVITIVLGVGVFFTLEKASGWYFDNYIVPAQQKEYHSQKP